MSEPDFIRLNKANWNEAAKIHFEDPADWYQIGRFLDGHDVRCHIDQQEMGDLSGLKVLHAQCHFGLDTLSVARQAREVVGLDFSPVALAQAGQLAERVGLADKARWIETNIYDARAALDETFDMVYASWGVTGWLPDLEAWAKIIASYVKPGGRFYYAEGHPCAFIMDEIDGILRPSTPYWHREPIVETADHSYNEGSVKLQNREVHCWNHPLSDFMTAFLAEGLVLEFFHEHRAVPWRMFPSMTMGDDRLYRFGPDGPNMAVGMSMMWRKPL